MAAIDYWQACTVAGVVKFRPDTVLQCYNNPSKVRVSTLTAVKNAAIALGLPAPGALKRSRYGGISAPAPESTED